MQGDDDSTNLPAVRRIARQLGYSGLVHVVDDRDTLGDPDWHIDGPRLDAAPHLNDAISKVARSLGVTKVFTGAGSDEILGATRFLLVRYLTRFRLGDFTAYWRDSIGRTKSAIWREIWPLVWPALPRRLRVQAYYAMLADMVVDFVPEIVATPFRPAVETWSAEWVQRRVSEQSTRRKSLAELEAWEAVDPIAAPYMGTVEISWCHPFMSKPVVDAIGSIGLVNRYDGSMPTEYWRRKALVLKLFRSKDAPDSLPRSKQTFSGWMSETQRSVGDAETLADLGIVKDSRISTLGDPMLVHRLSSLEAWCAGAVSKGYSFA